MLLRKGSWLAKKQISSYTVPVQYFLIFRFHGCHPVAASFLGLTIVLACSSVSSLPLVIHLFTRFFLFFFFCSLHHIGCSGVSASPRPLQEEGKMLVKGALEIIL